jgi:hypothetical protein
VRQDYPVTANTPPELSLKGFPQESEFTHKAVEERQANREIESPEDRRKDRK